MAPRQDADIWNRRAGWKSDLLPDIVVSVVWEDQEHRVRIGLANVTAAALALTFAASAVAEPAGWQVEGRPGATPYRLSFAGLNGGVGYSFECRPDGVLVTETAVTQLMDVQTGQRIGDEPGSSMTPGAAFLMLMTKPKPAPDFIPATATPNAIRGWDLSMLLPKTDRQWRALPRAEMVSLMSTGWTGVVVLDDSSRNLIAQFVKECGS